MSNYKSFRQDIPVKFIFEEWSMQENVGAVGYHADVKCAVCGKWNIRVYPTHEDIPLVQRKLSLEVLLKEIEPIIKKPLCSKCQTSTKALREREEMEKQ